METMQHLTTDRREADFGSAQPYRDTVREQRSLPSLLMELADETSTLFRSEMALARAELAQKMSQMQKGAVSVGAGSVIGIAALVMLFQAAVLALNQVIVEPWLSALIVGGVAAIIALIMVAVGRRKLAAPARGLERTASSLRSDAHFAREHLRRGNGRVRREAHGY